MLATITTEDGTNHVFQWPDGTFIDTRGALRLVLHTTPNQIDRDSGLIVGNGDVEIPIDGHRRHRWLNCEDPGTYPDHLECRWREKALAAVPTGA